MNIKSLGIVFILFFSNINLSKCNEISEQKLRIKLFKNYNKFTVPIINNSNIKSKIGITLNSIESFDQVNEKIKINAEIIQEWNDEYLYWDKNVYNISFININSELIWKPDIELYNAASLPELSSESGNAKVYYNGRIVWTRSILYTFMCPLKLYNFPYDTQTCKMTFGSWIYSNEKLNIKSFNSTDLYKNITVSNEFSHNEWMLNSFDVINEDIEYLCCPDMLWSVNTFKFTFDRKYETYKINMIMIAILTFTAIIISQFNITTYRRPYVLVFIPLSIIWIQIDIADKIPVIEYATLLENYYMVCFSTTIILALESLILHCYLIFNIDMLIKLIFLDRDNNKDIKRRIKYYKNSFLITYENNTKIIIKDKNMNRILINCNNFKKKLIHFDRIFIKIVPIIYLILIMIIIY